MKKFSFKKVIASFLATSMILTYVPAVDVYAAYNATPGITAGEFKLHEPALDDSGLAAGRADVDLDWDDYTFNVNGDSVSTDYYVARRPITYNNDGTKAGEWEIRGKYGKQVKVLNIYPDRTDAAGLQSWMATQSAANENVDIVVDIQSMSDFNKHPYGKLQKTPGGGYNYDVIVFGFWDSNNYAKISSDAAGVVQDFIDAGYGVIFGHDTIQHTGTSLGFNDLVQKNLDLIITSSNKSERWFYSDKISIKKQGAVTTYPFDINGKDLLIPMSHTVGQLPGNTTNGEPNDDIVYMTFEPNYYPSTGDGPYFSYNVNGGPKGPDATVTYNYNGKGNKEYIGNAYLVKDGNVAFIQCGHSSGKTNPAEQMLLANLIYSVAQISHGESFGYDQVLDEISPDTPEMNLNNPDLVDYTFNSKDHGIGYEYRIIAFPQGYDLNEVDENGIQTALSDPSASKFNDSVVFSNSYLTGELKSELKGSPDYGSDVDKATYRYYIDNQPKGTRIPPVEPSGVEDTTDEFYTLTYEGKFNYKDHYTSVQDIAPNDFLHVVAYDRANNASEVANFSVLSVMPKVAATVKYIYGKDESNISPGARGGDDGTKGDEEPGDGIVEYPVANYPLQYVGSNFSVKTIPDFIAQDGKNYVFSHSEDSTGTEIDPAAIVLDADSSKNVIVQVYDQLITKDIYLVDDRTALGDSTKLTPYKFTTVTLKEDEVLDINSIRPDLTDENYTYEGWSVLPKTNPNLSTKIQNGPAASGNYTMVDDANANAIYIYYKKDVNNVNVDVVRDLDGVGSGTETAKIGTYTAKGFVGDVIDVTGTDIKRNLTLVLGENLNNLTCYTNYRDLNRYHKQFTVPEVSTASDTVSDTFTLIPRSKYITYYGINYDGIVVPSNTLEGTTETITETTTSSAVTVTSESNSASTLASNRTVVTPNLETFGPFLFDPTVHKDGTMTHYAPAIYKSVWKNMKTNGTSDEPVNVNFANGSTVYVGYEQGAGLTERYNIKTEYRNVIGDKEIYPATDSPFLSVNDNTITVEDVVNIPDLNGIAKNIDDTNIAPNGRAVDFEFDHYEVWYGDNKVGSYTEMDDVKAAIPYNNGIGQYDLKVYYRPYSLVHYNKIVYGYDRTTEVSNNTYDFAELYDGKTHTKETMAMPNYTVNLSSEDDPNAVYEHGTLLDKVKLDVNAYDINVKAEYLPNTYNLIVNVVNDSKNVGEKDYKAYTFENIPANSKTQFNAPTVKGFDYITTDAVDATVNSYITTSSTTTDDVITNKITFKPDAKEVNASGTIDYEVNVHYGQKATLNVTYVVVGQGGTSTTTVEDTTHHVGDIIEFTVPDGEAVGYDLVLGYLDGELYTDGVDEVTGEKITGKVTKPKQHLYLVYNEPKYTLTVENASGDETGKAVGGGTFYDGTTATISAVPATGYTFSGWTISPSTVTVSAPNANGEQTLTMPAENVVATARFTKTGDGGDGDGEDIDTTNPEVTKPVEPEKPVVPEKPVDPVYPEKPQPPVKPEQPTIDDIHDLVNDPYYKLMREYSIYIHGYPDENIHPAGSITRAEVMAVIYNLYGNGYVSDEQSLNKFSDAESGVWYSPAIAFCVDFGIVNGYGNGTMEPNEPISRAELAAILAKFVVADNSDKPTSNFSDVDANWVKSSIDTLYQNGIVAGYEDGTFKPKAETKRSEFVVMVNRLIQRPEEYIEEKTFPDLPETHWAYSDMMNASNGVVVDQDLPDYIKEEIEARN